MKNILIVLVLIAILVFSATAETLDNMLFTIPDGYSLEDEYIGDDGSLQAVYSHETLDSAFMIQHIRGIKGIPLRAMTEALYYQLLGKELDSYNTLTIGDNTFSYFNYEDDANTAYHVSIFLYNDSFYLVYFIPDNSKNMAAWSKLIMSIKWDDKLNDEEPEVQTQLSPQSNDNNKNKYEVKEKEFAYTRMINGNIYDGCVWRVLTPGVQLSEAELKEIFEELCENDDEYPLHCAFFYSDWEYIEEEGFTFLDSIAYARIDQDDFVSGPVFVDLTHGW